MLAVGYSDSPELRYLFGQGLVIANQYRWCSARWHERTASAAQVKTIYGFPVTELKVKDDDDVAMS